MRLRPARVAPVVLVLSLIGIATGGASSAARARVAEPAPAGEAGGAGRDSVRLTFVVEVPPVTPDDAAIWIAGDLSVLGSWNGAGLRLAPLGGRCFAGAVTVPRGISLAFKVTRGGWDTVEKDARGGEIANREWHAGDDDTVRVVVGTWRDQVEPGPARAHTVVGEIRRHPAMTSRFVRTRDVLVYLPPGYGADTTRRYPVLYFHDGNNVFDAATSFLGIEWGVDETAERLIREGRVRPFIAVAVANTPDRIDEYTPAVEAGRGGGRASGYARFLVEELKPFLDAHYRTAPGPAHTGVVGSSLGGVISLYLALEHPDVFGLVGCLSPAAWWADGDIVRRVAAGRGPIGRVWVDIGTREGRDEGDRSQAVDGARALRDALRARGHRDEVDLHYEEVAGAGHDERAWAARVDRVITFLLGPPASASGR